MPVTLKQLGQRYIDTCENIREKRDYIIQNLDANITINVNNFFNDLSTDDLDKIEEALQNIRSAVKSEQTRRQLDERIKKIRDKKRQKLKKKQDLIFTRRTNRLSQATPYPLRTRTSITKKEDYVEDTNLLS